MAYLLLKGQTPAAHRMSAEEQAILHRTVQALRRRQLWKQYGIDHWTQQSYPAPVLDELLHLDQIEAAVIEDARHAP
jgi:hypothetical protein